MDAEKKPESEDDENSRGAAATRSSPRPGAGGPVCDGAARAAEPPSSKRGFPRVPVPAAADGDQRASKRLRLSAGARAPECPEPRAPEPRAPEPRAPGPETSEGPTPEVPAPPGDSAKEALLSPGRRPVGVVPPDTCRRAPSAAIAVTRSPAARTRSRGRSSRASCAASSARRRTC